MVFEGRHEADDCLWGSSPDSSNVGMAGDCVIRLHLDAASPANDLAAVDRRWRATGGDATSLLDQLGSEDHTGLLRRPVYRAAAEQLVGSAAVGSGRGRGVTERHHFTGSSAEVTPLIGCICFQRRTWRRCGEAMHRHSVIQLQHCIAGTEDHARDRFCGNDRQRGTLSCQIAQMTRAYCI